MCVYYGNVTTKSLIFRYFGKRSPTRGSTSHIDDRKFSKWSKYDNFAGTTFTRILHSLHWMKTYPYFLSASNRMVMQAMRLHSRSVHF